MSLRRLALLAAVLIAVGAYYYAIEHRGGAARERREVEAKQLFHFEVDDAAAIVFRAADGDLRLAKRDGRWHVLAPVTDRADEITVSGMLNALADLTPDRVLADPEALTEYGLADPERTVEVLDAGSDTVAFLHVGDLSPDQSQRFVQAKGSTTVGLMSTGTYARIMKSLFDVRHKQWTTLLPVDVQSLTLTSEDGLAARVTRGEDDAWVLEGDPPKAGDSVRIRGFLNTTLNARVMEFIDEPDAAEDAYGLQTPVYTATFAGDGVHAALRFGRTVPDSTPERRYAALVGESRVLVFNASLLKNAPAESDDLRDHKLGRVAEGKVTKLTIQTGEHTLTLMPGATDTDTWTLDGPEAAPADVAEIAALLDALEQLEASRFLHMDEEPVSPADFDQAAVQVELWYEDQDAPRTVRFAQGPATEKWYALRGGDAEVYPVADTQVTPFRVTRDQLLDKHVLRFDHGAVERVTIRIAGNEIRYSRRSDDTWGASPGAPPIAAERLDQFLWDLREMEYAERLAADDPAPAGDATFAVTLADVAGEDIATLRISARTDTADGATRYAADAGSGPVVVDGRLVSDWTPVFTTGS